ncbi:MAG: nucleotidyl transferase AbiEii/AbiGii toxin family protein [Bradyrhizobium sp.]
MKDEPANLPASILARLRNVARERRADPQLILRRYAIERLLFRLSRSPWRDKFILKGAMLYTAWWNDPFRPTQDLDLLGFGDPAIAAITDAFRAICQEDGDGDGLVFDAEGFLAEAIREDQDYGGVRVRTQALLGKSRLPVQIDIGFGDAVTPAPEELEFPPLLDAHGPRLRTYPKETVVAEKLQAIIALGQANSRMKDFYDLLVLSRLLAFDGALLVSAIAATFARRGTELPIGTPHGLSASFAGDAEKVRQWRAFATRETLLLDAPDLSATVVEIAAFVLPLLEAAAGRRNGPGRWTSGAGWEA